MNTLRDDANIIIQHAIHKVLPDEAVASALAGTDFGCGRIYLAAVGKAAWQMANKAAEIMSDPAKNSRLSDGIVITKYDHVKGGIPGIRCFEAAHPVPDDNTYAATEEVLKMVSDLSADDTVLFLLSGGGSALFEKPLVAKEEMADITSQLLACGADITEINTIRKRLSAVKGGRFAEICRPAKVFTIVLSDIIGDPLDMIASGPAYPDSSSCEDAFAIVEKYGLRLSETALGLLKVETPKSLDNVETHVTGSVHNLCAAAAEACENLGYKPVILTDRLCCEAREAGSFLASIVQSHCAEVQNPSAAGNSSLPLDSASEKAQTPANGLAFIAGGETVVHLTGHGKGGRNQELALSAAIGISGIENAAVFSIGSDGTDGPTDAAGGYCDGSTRGRLAAEGINIFDVLKENDAYHALKKVDGLIMTGATGTNVNDVAVALIKY